MFIRILPRFLTNSIIPSSPCQPQCSLISTLPSRPPNPHYPFQPSIPYPLTLTHYLTLLPPTPITHFNHPFPNPNPHYPTPFPPYSFLPQVRRAATEVFCNMPLHPGLLQLMLQKDHIKVWVTHGPISLLMSRPLLPPWS